MLKLLFLMFLIRDLLAICFFHLTAAILVGTTPVYAMIKVYNTATIISTNIAFFTAILVKILSL